MNDDSVTPNWERREPERDDAPITRSDLESALASAIRYVQNEQRAWRQESGRELKAIMSRPSSEEAEELRADLKEMRTTYKRAKWLVGIVGAPVFTLAAWAVRELVHSSGDQSIRDATVELRLQRAESDLRQIRERIYNQDRP